MRIYMLRRYRRLFRAFMRESLHQPFYRRSQRNLCALIPFSPLSAFLRALMRAPVFLAVLSASPLRINTLTLHRHRRSYRALRSTHVFLAVLSAFPLRINALTRRGHRRFLSRNSCAHFHRKRHRRYRRPLSPAWSLMTASRADTRSALLRTLGTLPGSEAHHFLLWN